ncbi:hypothetical protein ALC62_12090 [Cyphomyrmex costatus]|uniref:Uncharacterized protein n=1 Tax=Cyphomyrmex costatus TaxID=456900 RepID=A0A151IBW6_9HYME|nr:hypothetical protein ALC62_12090 [Cyphomyrmex costatus]
MWISEKLLDFLKETEESERDIVVGKLVKFDVIFTICEVMQTSDENFINAHKEFYDNQAAIITIQTMLRLSYCVNKSLKDSTLFERLIRSMSDILIRSLKLDVSFNTDCILQQIVFFVKNLDIKELKKNELKFTAIRMFNVILQKQATFDKSIDVEMIFDVCHDILKSMTKIVKCDDDDNTISFAIDSLCSTCASSARFCLMQDSREKNQTEFKICEKKDNLEISIYQTVMDIIIPYVKDNVLSSVDLIGFYRNLVFCLNNLYEVQNCNKDNLSNHLTANGYLKRLLYLTVQFPENLRRSTCILLSRILSILGETAFSIATTEFANMLNEGLVGLPKDSTQWNNAVARKRNGSVLIILIYYHYLGTRENDVISLESLITRIMLLPKYIPISVLILKPLWLLFAVTSLTHPRPNLVYHYENAVVQIMSILQRSDISEFYTHHVDLLHYCLKCPNVPQNLLYQILNLWLIESDGDIKPLSFNYDRVAEHLLDAIHSNCTNSFVNTALKGLRYLMQIIKDDKQRIDNLANTVWQTLPDIFSSYQSDNVTHIETALELANIIRPSTIPLPFIIRSADNITDIILNKNTDCSNIKFMTLVLTQAYNLLDVAMTRDSFNVLKMYMTKFQLLKWLHVYGFSKERSELSTASIKLLTFIIHCQKKSSLKCENSLTIKVKHLYYMLLYTKEIPGCIVNEMQFICELLTSNDDDSVVILQNIVTENDNMYLIEIYEILHLIHAKVNPISQDILYQSLITLLYFCNIKATKLMSYLTTNMSTYNLIKNVNMQRPSCHFNKFIIPWLHYHKTYDEHYIPWKSEALFKTPFDEILDKLKEYLIVLKNEKTEDAYTNLQKAVNIIFGLGQNKLYIICIVYKILYFNYNILVFYYIILLHFYIFVLVVTV